MLVIDALGTGTATVTLCYVRDYIISQLQHEDKLISSHTDLTDQYKNDTEELRKKIQALRTSGVTFQGSRCSACHHQLELPSLHFLCQHSYHQHCFQVLNILFVKNEIYNLKKSFFQSFSDNENECPVCLEENKSILVQLKAREHGKDIHETFHSQLDRAPDGFSVAAEYFGRSVFNKVTIVTEPSLTNPLPPLSKESTPVKSETEYKTTEGRLRQTEGKSSVQPVSISEGRLRLQERQYNSSLEANLKSSPKMSPKPSPRPSNDTLSTILVNKGEDYDEAKNPFSDDGNFNDGNPFENEGNPFGDVVDDDDDYDKNLNPFAA